MTILVTGGAGFIGGHVVDALLARGDHVLVIDDLNDYYDPRFKRATVNHHQKNPHYTFVQANITDKAAMERIVAQHDVTSIIHLAARAGVRPSLANPLLYVNTNVEGTVILLELARTYAMHNFVFASSSSVYGDTSEIPFSESTKIDNQQSPYAVTKKTGENLCAMYSTTYGLPTTALRFFTVYGPRGRPDMAPMLFMDAIARGKPLTMFGDGTSSRDYTYVGDVVSGILAAHDRPRPFMAYNLGNDKPVTLKQFIQTIEAVVGKQAIIERREAQLGDVEKTWADISLARKNLGYQPKTDLREGLANMYAWYEQRDRSFTGNALAITPALAPKNTQSHWSDFVSQITEEQIAQAQAFVASKFGTNLKNKQFLDLGSGSGLYSLAAAKLGANVLSVDHDPYAIRAATQLRARFAPKANWRIERAALFDEQWRSRVGQFDIVFSWGYLHRSGDLRRAVTVLPTLLKSNGNAFAAIYNDSKKLFEGSSKFWAKAKEKYRKLHPATQSIASTVYATYLLTGVLSHGRNPITFVRNYSRNKGMRFMTDVKDWLSGLPYEYGTLEDMTSLFEKNGLTVKETVQARSLGCNEFVLHKSS